MNILDYNQLKKEFKKKNFAKYKKTKKKKLVIDGTKFNYKEKSPRNSKFWREIVDRVDGYDTKARETYQ